MNLNGSLPGYYFVFESTNSSHGGAGCFISNDIPFKCRSDLNMTLSGSLESIFIELTLTKTTSLVCGCIYRHPHMSINGFNDNYMNVLLENIKKENKSCILMGDFNIDLMRSAANNAISNFLETMSSSFFATYILQPTHVTLKSKT